MIASLTHPQPSQLDSTSIYRLRTPAEPMPAPMPSPINDPPDPMDNPDAPVREPDPEEPQQI